jgi:cytochrome c553
VASGCGAKGQRWTQCWLRVVALAATLGASLGVPGWASAQTVAGVPALLPVCGGCHGLDGNATQPGMPSLAGQPRTFLENQLVLIREGLRDVPTMKAVLANTKDEDLVALAKAYAAMPVKPLQQAVDAQRLARGAEISKGALCGSCHLPDYAGKDQMPRLAGQREDFLLANMKQFRDGPPAGRDTVMASTLRGMTDADLQALAHYFATQGLPK